MRYSRGPAVSTYALGAAAVQLSLSHNLLSTKTALVCSASCYNLDVLLTVSLRRRMCSIYCTVLLLGVYASTCYWNLAPASETLLASLSLPKNTTLSAASETISACWCDFNGGALLKPRILLKNVASSNGTVATSQHIKFLPLDEVLINLAPIRWLATAIDNLSKGYTESLLGIKVTL